MMPTDEELAASKSGTEAADLWFSAAEARETEAAGFGDSNPCERADAWAKAWDDYAAAAMQQAPTDPQRAFLYSELAAIDAKKAAEAFEACGQREDDPANKPRRIGSRPWIRAKLYWTRVYIHYDAQRRFWQVKKVKAFNSGDDEKYEEYGAALNDALRREDEAAKRRENANGHIEQ
jgi:hypothetical protein